jgi:hypothetical protein
VVGLALAEPRAVVTDRFADFCHDGEFTGVVLTPTANFEPSWSKRLRGTK